MPSRACARPRRSRPSAARASKTYSEPADEPRGEQKRDHHGHTAAQRARATAAHRRLGARPGAAAQASERAGGRYAGESRDDPHRGTPAKSGVELEMAEM